MSCQEAFVDMIKQHERMILKVCAMYSYCPVSDLRDLYQDAVVALWESYDSYKGLSKPSTWIYSVVMHTMLNKAKKNRMKVVLTDEQLPLSKDEDYDTDQLIDELRQVVNKLPDDEKDIVLMYMEGFDNQEIAQAKGSSYGAVATRLTRIKTKLRKIMNP